MPTPQWIRDRSLERRKRTCQICGTEFYAKNASMIGATCSKPCFIERNRRIRIGHKHTDETKAKMAASQAAFRKANPAADAARQAKCAAKLRAFTQTPEFAAMSSERMKKRHADPDWQPIRDARSSQVMRANWLKHRDSYTAAIRERYDRYLAIDRGIGSTEAERRKREAAKWIMKRAQADLHADTEFDELWVEVLAEKRALHPYDGPLGTADYHEYCKRIGKLVTQDQRIRELADRFMAKAIPRAAAAWQDMKGFTPPPPP